MNAALRKEPTLALVTKLEVHSSDVSRHLDWLARFMMLGVESAGALSAEIFPPSSSSPDEWELVQRFASLEQIEAWQKSVGHRKLMDELSPYLENQQVMISEIVDASYITAGGIAVAVATHVKAGQEKAYFAYESKYQSAQARRPGYRGAYVQPPTNHSNGTWITTIRFDTSKSMDAWFASEERKKLVAEAEHTVSSTNFQSVTTSFPGWFPSETNAHSGPPNWKAAMLILLGLYPSVMLVIKFLMPLAPGIHPALTNFVGNILTVAFTTFVTMPLFIKVYNAWLFPTESTPKWVNPLSVISLLFFFVLEIAIFWRIF